MNISAISTDRKYWFIRTDHGSYYEEFIAKRIVAIDWNEISDIELIKSATSKEGITPEEQKLIQEKDNELDRLVVSAYPEEKRHRNVVRQIKDFVSCVKKGDIVVIPSKHSWLLTFGEVESEELVPIPDDYDGDCNWIKRKKVLWLKTVERDKLDPYLFKLFYSQHTVTDANPYALFIDRTLHSFFIKGEKAHLVLDVASHNRIYAKELMQLIYGTIDILDEFNSITGSALNTNEIEIKINVQSPGTVEFIALGGIIAALGLILVFIVGGTFEYKFNMKEFYGKFHTDGLLEKILKFKQVADKRPEIQEKCEKVRSSIDKLEVEIPRELSSQPGEGSNKKKAD